MKRFLFPLGLATLVIMGGSKSARAHCEVPCGIYADQARFERMLEDTATIEKAMAQIRDNAGKTDALAVNQTVRWVNTKETHATNTQHIIAQYFMTQRIKPAADRYEAQLKSAHEVMLAAMKCKQTVDAKNAAALKQCILNFHKAYEGK